VYYETTFIVNPDVSQDNTQNITNQLVERVEKAGGRVIKREYWGARMMAYSINKRKRGHYMFLVTDGDGAAIAALEDAIRLDERIVRFLSVRSESFSDKPSPLARRSKPVATPDADEETTKDSDADATTEATATTEEATASPATEAATTPEVTATAEATASTEAAPAAEEKTTESPEATA